MKVDVEGLIRPHILKMVPFSSARSEFKRGEKKTIFLDANENPFENGVNRYPDPNHEDLKNAISKQTGIDTKQLFLGNGSDEILDLILRVFCTPKKDKIITLPPTFSMYGVLANFNDVKNVSIPLDEKFEPIVDDILKTEAKILFLCSPNNPTGNSIKREVLERLVSNFRGIVVLDEAYIDFSLLPSGVGLLSKCPNLIITQTLSKSWAMAGLRLGICYASEFIVKILSNVKSPYNISSLNQKRGVEILQETKQFKQHLNDILTEKKRVKQVFESVSFIEKVYPSDANFLLIKVDNAPLRYQQLVAQGVVARDRSKEISCSNCLRVTIGTKEENDHLIKIVATDNC